MKTHPTRSVLAAVAALAAGLSACDRYEAPTGLEPAGWQPAPAVQMSIADFPDALALVACHKLEIKDLASVGGGDVHVDGDVKVESPNGIVGGDLLAAKKIEFKGDGSVGGSARSMGEIKAEDPDWLVRVGGVAANPAGEPTLQPGQAAGGISHDPADYTFPMHCRDPQLREDLSLSGAEFEELAAQARLQGSHRGDVKVEAGGVQGGWGGQHYIDGKLEIKGIPAGFVLDGLYFVRGDLKIEAAYAGRATFVVLGKVEIKTTLDMRPADGASHVLVVGHDAVLEGGGVLYGSIWVGHDFRAKWNGEVHGSLIAMHDVKLEKSLALNLPVTAVPHWFQEDFSGFASSEAWRTVVDGTYRNAPLNPGQQFIDPLVGHGGLTQSLRYDFPDRTASADRCSDYGILRNLWLPEPVEEVWVEAWVMFDEDFHTAAPPEWGCPSNPEMQALFGTIHPGGNGDFRVSVGVGGDGWAVGAPNAGVRRVAGVAAEPYWDGQWHRVRVHWKLGTGTGVLRLWLDDALVGERVGLDTGGAELIWGLTLGGYMNQGPDVLLSYWWGRLRIWNVAPGW